jgi:hypothetical protein
MMRGNDNYVPVAQFPKREKKQAAAGSSAQSVSGSTFSTTFTAGTAHGIRAFQKDARATFSLDASRNGSILPFSDVTTQYSHKEQLGLFGSAFRLFQNPIRLN